MVLDKIGHLHKRDRSDSKASAHSTDDTANGDDETVVDEQQGNVLSHIISQLRPGADLNKVTLPTFILEPRSMLERITNFMAHPELMLPLPDIEDPVQRFVSVVKFYLSGWHIKPPGVKKPLNPILGETFYGWWDYSDGTRGYYISEQTSHHPPKSSYFFMAPEHHIRIDGTLKPRSKFLGNSAASMMEGIAVMTFLNRREKYFITQPNMYARGILFGKMKYELGDHSFVRCPELGLMADLEFKTKGYFSGGYDGIEGVIKEIKTDHRLYELSGKWNGEMHIKNLSSSHKELLFDASRAKETHISARPMEEQEPTESQLLWNKVISALKQKNHDVATDEKSRIEDHQREEAAKHPESEWHPRLFRPVRGGKGSPEEGMENLDWIIKTNIDGRTPEEQVGQILALAPILPKHMLQSTQQKAPHDEQKGAPADTQQGMHRKLQQGVQGTPPAMAEVVPPAQGVQPQMHQGVSQDRSRDRQHDVRPEMTSGMQPEIPDGQGPQQNTQRDNSQEPSQHVPRYIPQGLHERMPEGIHSAAEQERFRQQSAGDGAFDIPSRPLPNLTVQQSRAAEPAVEGSSQIHHSVDNAGSSGVSSDSGLRPTIVAPRVKRIDTNTDEVDVFIDAKS